MNFALLSILSLAPALPAQDEPLEPIPEANAALYDAQSALADWRIQKLVDHDSARGRAVIGDLALAAEAVARTLDSEPAVDNLHEVWFEQLHYLVERGFVKEASGLARRLESLAELAGEEAYTPLVRAAKSVLARDDAKALVARIPSAVRIAAKGAGVQQAEDVVIANAVRDAVRRDARDEVLGLGSRAVPTLVELAQGVGPTPSATEADRAFKMLLFADRAAALDLAVELAARDSYLVKKRLADVLNEVRALDDDNLWSAVEDESFAPKNPAWVGLVTDLTSPPGVEPHIVAPLVEESISRGHAPEPVTDLAFRIGMSALPARTSEQQSRLAVAYRALEDPREDVRYWGLDQLAQRTSSEHSTEIAGLAGDPSPRIRSAVASVLRPRAPKRVRSSAEPTVYPVANDVTRGALARLIVDSDPGVRSMAISSVQENQGAGRPLLSAETIREAATGSPAQDVREILFQLAMTAGSDEEDAKTVAALFDDPSPELRDYPYHYLRNGSYAQEDPELFWRLVDEHYVGDRSKLQPLVDAAAPRMRNSQDWRDVTLDWLIAKRDAQAWEWAWIPRNFSSNWIDVLDDSRQVEVLRAAREAGFELNTGGVQTDAGPWIALAASDADPRLRIHAARQVIRHGTHEADVIPHAVDAIATWQTSEVDGSARHAIDGIRSELKRRPGHHANFLAQLVADRRILPGLMSGRAFAVMSVVGASERSNRAYFDAFIDRFPLSSWDALDNYAPLYVALRCAPENDEARIQVFEAALFSGDQTAVRLSPSLVAQVRDPRVLAALKRYVDEGRAAALPEIAELASSYLTDEAAEIILAAAALEPDAARRAQILASLDQITAYQDARARWQRRTDAAAKRVEAIGELLAIADDAAQPVESRAEALRGLALLEAVEELPRLVRALASEEAAIREAARAALDRLNKE